LRLSDIAAIAELAHARGAKLAADNTFATPAIQRPLALGADIVLHSTTKYLGGHSDVVGGAIVVRDRALADRLQFLQNASGAVPGPLDCFLVLRGLKTLHLRMERHCANARRIAAFLSAHPRVERVHYPGTGGMVSFELRGAVADAERVCARTRIFSCAESLGGVESLIEAPALMTHASIPAEVRKKSGLADGLIRLSVGIEDAEDLLADLEQALSG
jgi:cystathionine beta-lyase/cystathionine gamma-synthase